MQTLYTFFRFCSPVSLLGVIQGYIYRVKVLLLEVLLNGVFGWPTTGIICDRYRGVAPT